MRNSLGRLALVALPATLALGVGVATAGDPAPTGPVYPAPGSPPATNDGNLAIAPGGVTWTYDIEQPEKFERLMWSAWSGSLPRLAMDGAADENGETLAFSSFDSASGSVVYTGQAEYLNSGNVRPTRVVLRAMNPNGSPLSVQSSGALELPGDIGAAALIPGDFKSNMRAEVFNGSAWVPAKSFYDSQPKTPADADKLITSIGAGFYHVPANKLPVASFDWTPQTPTAGRTVSFTSTSTDEDGEIVSTEWDLDDDGEFDDATGGTAQTVFSEAGDHEVSVRVTDNRDDATTASHTITVVPNEAPEASFAWSPEDPKALETVTFDSTSTDSDGAISTTEWDLDGDGEYDDATGASASQAFAEAGEYTVGVRVTDDLGGTDIATATVVVSTCEQTAVSQTLRQVGVAAGIEQQIRQVNCEVLEPLGI